MPFRDICDKRALDQLFLCYITVNHTIELTQANSLNYSLLYQITIEKLFTIKEYLLKTFTKGLLCLTALLLPLLCSLSSSLTAAYAFV
jgi:hypothetical protein